MTSDTILEFVSENYDLYEDLDDLIEAVEDAFELSHEKAEEAVDDYVLLINGEDTDDPIFYLDEEEEEILLDEE